MFINKDFAPIGGVTSGSPSIYSYITNDSNVDVEGIGYFIQKQHQLESNDLIFVHASNGYFVYKVDSDTSTVITAGIGGSGGGQGPQGIQGEKGDTGDTGLTGLQGSIGLTGSQGIQGDTGLQGDTGSQGIQGDTGLQGDKGDPGTGGGGAAFTAQVQFSDDGSTITHNFQDNAVITEVTTGWYRLTFDTPMTDTSYRVMGTASASSFHGAHISLKNTLPYETTHFEFMVVGEGNTTNARVAALANILVVGGI